MSDGELWRFEWKSNGYYFSRGAAGGRSDTGRWRVKDGTLCAQRNKSGDACAELRIVDDVLELKRASDGEVVALQPGESSVVRRAGFNPALSRCREALHPPRNRCPQGSAAVSAVTVARP